jgi:adenylosuccinate synthase
LPATAQNYLRRLESIVGIPVDMVSTGADRDHNIILRHPFD